MELGGKYVFSLDRRNHGLAMLALRTDQSFLALQVKGVIKIKTALLLYPVKKQSVVVVYPVPSNLWNSVEVIPSEGQNMTTDPAQSLSETVFQGILCQQLQAET